MWINQGDIILIGLRDYQDAKADVILRYNPDEARNLKAYGELPETGVYSLYFVCVVCRIECERASCMQAFVCVFGACAIIDG